MCALAGCGLEDPSSGKAGVDESETNPSVELITPNYTILSTAEQAATHRAGMAAEGLFEAYSGFFDDFSTPEAAPALRIRLYASRSEFLAHSSSRPWAEAYYVDGVCHAYVDSSKPNPHHWLMHEAVHQLNRELTGYAKEQWINEGLATYFGSSRFVGGRLEPGVPDLDTYPLWWLKRWELAGDWASDVQSQRVIPLRTLITGQGGPGMDAAVNAYYLGWWSLTHFLLHYDEGRYAAGYHHLIRHGGTLAEFERLIGPVEQVEAEWYAHFQTLVAMGRDTTH